MAWILPPDLVDDAVLEAAAGIAPLDLEAETRRYGAATPGRSAAVAAFD